MSIHLKHAPSEIVRTIKSITAREIWEQHELLLARVFWGSFWERSFYVGTTGEMSSRTVERYTNRTEHVWIKLTRFISGLDPEALSLYFL
ncbi:hypothetical protein GCM10009000_084570 [Halobacterium noricense]